MYSDNFTKIRQFLLVSGFVPEQGQGESGIFYRYAIPEYKTYFETDLSKPCLTAVYPDFAFNRRNPYSGKDTVVSFEWNGDEDQELTIKSIEAFIDKILMIVKRG